jgi:hypothetical protein
VTDEYALPFGDCRPTGSTALRPSRRNGEPRSDIHEIEVVMPTEELIIHSARPLHPLLTAVEHAGGSAFLLERGGRRARLARLVLPDDPERAARCRELIDDWSTAGAWPLGHPRHRFDQERVS